MYGSIREAIVASKLEGDLDNSHSISTTVGELDDYGRACNQAGYGRGLVKGTQRGFAIAMTGVVTGFVAAAAADYIQHKIRTRKDEK